MHISLSDIGKRFHAQWLYKGIETQLVAGSATAITGNNGSGKSTLIQLIYGFQVPTRGKVTISSSTGANVAPDQVHAYTSFVAPYLELPEELTLHELLQFHFHFKRLRSGVDLAALPAMAGLSGNEHKQIRNFSSGMKQRVKLLLALFSEHELLLLDEPCTNLDAQGIAWYRDMLLAHKGKATILVASNQLFEYDFCESVLDLTAYRVS